MMLIGVGSLVGLLVLSCGLGGYLAVRTVWNTNEDHNRLRLVALSMLNYESSYKRLPTPVVKDGAGKPVYSWTVTVLPYIEPPAELINFDQSKLLAWDAPVTRFCVVQRRWLFDLLEPVPRAITAMYLL